MHPMGQRYSQSRQCSFSSEVSENFYIPKSIDETHRGSYPGYDQEESQAVWCSARPTPVVHMNFLWQRTFKFYCFTTVGICGAVQGCI